MQMYSDEPHLQTNVPFLLHSLSRQRATVKSKTRGDVCAHRITPENEFTGIDPIADFGSLSQHEIDCAVEMGLMPPQAQIAPVITTQGVMPETVGFGVGWLR